MGFLLTVTSSGYVAEEKNPTPLRFSHITPVEITVKKYGYYRFLAMHFVSQGKNVTPELVNLSNFFP